MSINKLSLIASLMTWLDVHTIASDVKVWLFNYIHSNNYFGIHILFWPTFSIWLLVGLKNGVLLFYLFINHINLAKFSNNLFLFPEINFNFSK